MIKRIAALTALLACASGVVPSPAHADTLSGLYTATGTSDGKTKPQTWLIIPCGSDCIRVQWNPPSPKVNTLHRQDGVWTGTDRSNCTTTIDEGSMTGSYGCGQGPAVPFELIKSS